jgi:hypothetical protein
MRSLTDSFAVDAHLRRREVDEFLLAIGVHGTGGEGSSVN